MSNLNGMIVNFSVKNYKSIKDRLTLSFEPSASKELQNYYFIEPVSGTKLLKLALIYGPNGSGKTTILEALDFLRNLVTNPFQKKTDEFDFNPFLFDSTSRNEVTLFDIQFFQNGIKYGFELEFNQRAILRERLFQYLTAKRSLIYDRETNLELELTQIRIGSKTKMGRNHKEALEANTLWNNTVLGGFLKTNIESKELKEVSDWFQGTLQSIITPRSNLLNFVSKGLENGSIKKENVLMLLKKADLKIDEIIVKDTDDAIQGDVSELITYFKGTNKILKESADKIFASTQFNKELWFQHKVSFGKKQAAYDLQYSEESQGTQRYFQFSGVLDFLLRNESVFFIDELESSLHPDLVKHFLLVFLANSKQSQLIATTHYRELLMERDILRHDTIWFTEKQEDGGADLFSLADFDSAVIRKDTGSIFNAYKTGKLGANPITRDYFISLNE